MINNTSIFKESTIQNGRNKNNKIREIDIDNYYNECRTYRIILIIRRTEKENEKRKIS